MPVRKDKKRGTWYASFYYTDWTGQRRRKKKEGFATRGAALDFEREFITKQGGGPDMTFSALAELYLADCRARLKRSTCETKETLFRTHLLPVFGQMQLKSITPGTVRQWQNSLLDGKADYAPTYLKGIHTQLSAAFNYGKRYCGLQTNPAALCGSMGKTNAGDMQFWTKDEFSVFAAAVQGELIQHAIFQTFFWTGIRSGELLALTLDDINFANKTISINKTFSRIKREDVISPPKTPKSTRVVTAPGFLLDMLRDYADRLVDYNPSDRLFPYTKEYLQQQLAKWAKTAGVKRIRVHDLRHSHASLLIELGFSPLLISERLGHENVQTTLETYAHLYPNKQGELASKLDEINASMSAPKAVN